MWRGRIEILPEPNYSVLSLYIDSLCLHHFVFHTISLILWYICQVLNVDAVRTRWHELLAAIARLSTTLCISGSIPHPVSQPSYLAALDGRQSNLSAFFVGVSCHIASPIGLQYTSPIKRKTYTITYIFLLRNYLWNDLFISVSEIKCAFFDIDFAHFY